MTLQIQKFIIPNFLLVLIKKIFTLPIFKFMLKTSIWTDLTKKPEIYLLRQFSNLNRPLGCSVTPHDIHFRTEITRMVEVNYG